MSQRGGIVISATDKMLKYANNPLATNFEVRK